MRYEKEKERWMKVIGNLIIATTTGSQPVLNHPFYFAFALRHARAGLLCTSCTENSMHTNRIYGS